MKFLRRVSYGSPYGECKGYDRCRYCDRNRALRARPRIRPWIRTCDGWVQMPFPLSGGSLGPFEGYGSGVTGGQGQTLFHVTALSGAGSLESVLSSGNRYIDIQVTGDSGILGNIQIQFNNVTVDGSTAPGIYRLVNGGIGINRGANNIILAYLRIRANDGGSNGDCIGIDSDDGVNIPHDIVVDHCSLEGGNDSEFDCSQGSHTITFSWSIIGPSASVTSAGDCLIANNTAPGTTANPTRHVSVHHNLFAGLGPPNGNIEGDRHPQVNSDLGDIGEILQADIRNNVVWGWGRQDGAGVWHVGHGTQVNREGTANVVNNFYQTVEHFAAGPFDLWDAAIWMDDGGASGGVYVAGNRTGNTGALDPNRWNNHAEYSIPSANQITMDQVCNGAALVMAGAGCRIGGVDSVDAALLAQVSLANCPPEGGGDQGPASAVRHGRRLRGLVIA
jgi:hypothetical protein